MAAFGAVGEFASTEYLPFTVVALLRADTITVTFADTARAFAPAQMRSGDIIEVQPEDRSIIVLANGRHVTRDDLSGG